MRSAVVLAFAMMVAGCFNVVNDDVTIEGTIWRAVSVVGMAPVAGREPTLNLGPGKVTGSAGCNGYGSQGLTVGRATVHISGLGMQAVLCSDPRLMQIEAAFFPALRDAERFELRNGQLVLSGASGELVFEQLPGP